MKFLDKIIEKIPEYKTLKKTVKIGSTVAVTGLSGIHKAHIINSLPVSMGMGAFVVAYDEHEAQIMANDLTAMGKSVCVYPVRDFLYKNIKGHSREYEHQRINVLCKIIENNADVVITRNVDDFIQTSVPVMTPSAYLSSEDR